MSTQKEAVDNSILNSDMNIDDSLEEKLTHKSDTVKVLKATEHRQQKHSYQSHISEHNGNL